MRGCEGLGGWGDPESANSARGMLKDLAGILYHVVPHAGTFRSRGNMLPRVLVDCTEPVTSSLKSKPESEFTQVMANSYYRKMDTVIGNDAND